MMNLEPFEMERMQSTWENIVEMDLSESGVRPLTLRELTTMGFDLEGFLDVPLGYSQSNGTLELREMLTKQYPGATVDNMEVTNGTSEANLIVAMTLLRDGDDVALQVPNYMQYWGVPRGLGAAVKRFPLRVEHDWEPDWDAFEESVTAKTKLIYLSNPNNPSGSVLSRQAMQRIVERCEKTGTWLLADEVYLGAELSAERTPSFWGMSDLVIVTSGLSKAYGIPGVRIGWIVGPKEMIAACWGQHDYITIGPNKMSDAIARIAVDPANREKCYNRTRGILNENLPIIREWAASFGGFLEWREPKAGALALLKYHSPEPSIALCERIRERKSVLIVPGVHLGLESHLRIWLGGKPDFLREGLRRIGEELRLLM